MKTTKTILAIAFVAIGAISYTIGTKHGDVKIESVAVPAQPKLDINPVAGVKFRDIEYSVEDCELVASTIASAQRIRNFGGSLELALSNIEGLRDGVPAAHAEYTDIFYNIWERPVNSITVEEAQRYGKRFCEAHDRH